MGDARPPAMSDVAVRAGVSHQTVSRVLNGHPNVRAETRERVLDAIVALGYRPNRAARALVTARSSTIGVLTSGTTHFGPASTMNAIVAAARAVGYFVSVSALESHDPDAATAALGQLFDQGVDGVIVVAPLEDVAHVVDGLAPGVPVVVVAARPTVPADSPARYVHADQRRGSEIATEHLVALGHTAIVHVAGPAGWFDAAERADMHREVMRRHGLEPAVVDAGGWSARRGYAVGRELAEAVGGHGGPTAVFAANDYISMGLLRAFWERGVRVPEDVSLVGFDDIEGSAYLVPALTTVRQHFEDLGRAAVAVFLDEAAGHRDPSAPRVAAVIEPELVVRASTARLDRA